MYLFTEERIKFIADAIYKACLEDGDLLSIKRIQETIDETDKAIEMAEQLESETHDFVIQISDGSLLLLRTVDDVYLCETNEEYASDYALKHSIKIENVNGIIILTT